MDKSLKVSGGLHRMRSVLTRAERITKMIEDEKWQEGRSPLGLPKTKVVRAVIKKKKKEAIDDEDKEGAEATPEAS